MGVGTPRPLRLISRSLRKALRTYTAMTSFSLTRLGEGPLGIITRDVLHSSNHVMATFQNLRLVSKDMSTALLPFAPKFTVSCDGQDNRLPTYRRLLERMLKISNDTHVHLCWSSEDCVRRCLALIAMFSRTWMNVRTLVVSNSVVDATAWMPYAAHYFPSVQVMKIRLGQGQFVFGDEISSFGSLTNLSITGQNKSTTFANFQSMSLDLPKLDIQGCNVSFRVGMTIRLTRGLDLQNCHCQFIPQNLHVAGALNTRKTSFVTGQGSSPLDFVQGAFLEVQRAVLNDKMGLFLSSHPAYFKNVTHLTFCVDNNIMNDLHSVSWASIFDTGPSDLVSLTIHLLPNNQLNALTRLQHLQHLDVTLQNADVHTRALHGVVRQLASLKSLTVNFAENSFMGPNVASFCVSMSAYVSSLRTAARARGVQRLTLHMFAVWFPDYIVHRPENREGIDYFTIHDGQP